MNRFTAAVVVAAASAVALPGVTLAQDVSASATLQWFEASWDTIEHRSVDAFVAGYGAVWVPPTGQAQTGGFSVGYDVYDRFDLGSPDQRTLYGTETELRGAIGSLQRFGGSVYADLIWNHNGFADETEGNFAASGGYPGFTLSAPGTPRGDFHINYPASDEKRGRLSNLLDIDHSLNIRYVRNPVPGFNNVPAGDPQQDFFGKVANLPSEANRRFYQDRTAGPSATYFDPRLNQTVNVYDFQPTTGREATFAGEPVEENATGYLMRNARWMIQDVGFDGFRLDAVKHMEPWVLEYLDQAVYAASHRTHLDGSERHVFSFGEMFEGDTGRVQDYIRKDIDPSQPNRVGGNRDALDIPLHLTLRNHLSANGLQNDWRTLVEASQDRQDDGLANNGSQGVAFAQSHDEGPAHLNNTAHAYLAMRPGNFVVYHNAKEFGDGRDFPKDGRGDALGGLYGDTITTLVELRNTHGRGNYLPRLTEKETLVYERENSALVVLSNRLDAGFDERTVQTAFTPGTRLVEATGNAASSGGDIAEVLTVKSDGTVDLRARRNPDDAGYLIYALPTPEGTLTLTGTSGTLAGQTPTAATNGTARLADLAVVTGDSFGLALDTTPVTLADGYRDFAADGDAALFRVNGGLDLNADAGVDHVDPGDQTVYGFERFTDKASALALGGDGEFRQSIDATDLPEGVNFVEVRGFRQRTDGGPAVYTSWREGIYVDRVAPPTEMAGVEEQGPGRPATSRDFVVRSTDATANSVHVFLDLPANLTDAEVLARVSGGNSAGRVDRDTYQYGFDGLTAGNHALTVVAFEPTGNFSVTRFSGLFTDTGLGLGLGDVDSDGAYTAADVFGAGAFEQFLYSAGDDFNAAADLDGDGIVTTPELFALEDIYADAGATAAAAEARAAVLRRGNVNRDGFTDAGDLDALAAGFGSADWYLDLDADGVAGRGDVDLLVSEVFETAYGDADLDGVVNFGDFEAFIARYEESGGWAEGDFDGSGFVDLADFALLSANYGFGIEGGLPGTTVYIGGAAYALGTVPEPASALTLAGLACLGLRRRR